MTAMRGCCTGRRSGRGGLIKSAVAVFVIREAGHELVSISALRPNPGRSSGRKTALKPAVPRVPALADLKDRVWDIAAIPSWVAERRLAPETDIGARARATSSSGYDCAVLFVAVTRHRPVGRTIKSGGMILS